MMFEEFMMKIQVLETRFLCYVYVFQTRYSLGFSRLTQPILKKIFFYF